MKAERFNIASVALASAIALMGLGCGEPGASGGGATTVTTAQTQVTAAPTSSAPPKVSGWEGTLQNVTVALYKERSFCSGTWVSNHAVLTAAHCVEEMDPASFFVVPGADSKEPKVKLKTGGVYIHPSYLAARRLSSAVALAPQIASDLAVVSVPSGKPEDARLVTLDAEHSVRKQQSYRVAGHGQLNAKGGSAESGKSLRTASMTALYKLANKDVLPKGASGHYWVLDGGNVGEVCQNDSGGPAFWISGNDIMQFGVNALVLPGGATDVAEIQRLGDKTDRGEPWSKDEVAVYSRFLGSVKNMPEQSCSRLLSVVSVGEMRDWIKGRSEEIEHDAGAR